MSIHHGLTARTKVPMLRKLTSEKNSLDLDRPAMEQDVPGLYADTGMASRSSHDVGYIQRGYHARSTSGTSQFSTTTTGSFVHPFQQTPRPYTPPIAVTYHNSSRESELSHTNSPVFTEEDDEQQARSNTFRTTNSASSPVISQSLRIQTKIPSSSRLALAPSHTNLTLTPDLTSPVDTLPSPSIRTSMEKGFRIRSRSEVEPRLRAETIQEARRKFAEKEQAKEEKAAREEIRALEKRNQKEARQIERGHRRSSASERPAHSKRSKSDLTMQEKPELGAGFDYESARPIQDDPHIGATNNSGERYEERKRRSAKKKTQSAWQKLMMWLRTRILRMRKK
ncbi:hypothetical protein B7494_g8473 [Chlorociboria aeruginascens]|nr:hypothetical protein B7494_g8473 [Chlorociboria aeruginascens]